MSVAGKGKPKPAGFGEKISVANKGKQVSEETRERLRQAQRLIIHSNGGHSLTYGRKLSKPNWRKGLKLTEEQCKNQHKFQPRYGADNPRYGKTAAHGKRIRSSMGEVMRSSWETKFADWLTNHGIGYIYEPHRFYLTNRFTYLPDFYIPVWDVYVEIKGREKSLDYDRIMSFILTNNRLVYLNRDAWVSIDWNSSTEQILKYELGKHTPAIHGGL